MSVKDILNSTGSWSLKLHENTPDEVLAQLDYFGHVAILNGPADVLAVGDNLLAAARYVGVLRERVTSPAPALSGVSLVTWLGDEDGKGDVLENKVTLTNASLSAAVAAVLPPSVQLGTVYSVAGTYTGTFQFQTPREALDVICAAFGAEWLVNGAGRLFVGTTAQLYSTTPTTVVSRRNVGTDMDLVALGGQFDSSGDVVDYTTRVLLIGQTTDAGTFATGSADAPSVPYKNLFGGTVKRTRLISESGTPVGTVAQRAGLALNRFNRQRRALKVTTERYETDGTFRVGEFAYVYDPESGVFDPVRQITFRGEVLHPDVVRITAIGYPLTEGHTVGFRRGDGTWLDLTRYVMWETGTNEVTVGDLPQSLGGGRVNVAADRADASSVDLVAPKAPTALDVQTTVLDNGTNGLSGVATMTWVAPTQNADNTALTDLDGYVAQYKLSTGGTAQWTGAFVAGTGTSFPVVPGRNYDFRVYAVDKNGNRSDPSATVSKLSVLDTTPPNAPTDPQVSNYLGQLRIRWDGKMADGSNPPADFFQVDVHVGTTAGFTPDVAANSTTLVASLLEAGVAFATAPYGEARYVKLVALDRSANRSTPSGSVAGTTAPAGDGDVSALNVGKLVSGTMMAEVAIGGRFATSLTGARVELNSTGIYKVTDTGDFAVAIDGTQALLTGVYKTAVSGRRLEIASSGAIGKMRFINPDGTESSILGFTSTNATGEEALVFQGPNSTPNGAATTTLQLIETGQIQYRAINHQFTMESLGGATGTGSFGVFSVGSLRLNVNNDGVSMYGSANALRAYVYQGGLRVYGNNSAQALDITDNGMILWAGGSSNPRIQVNNGTGQITLRPGEFGQARMVFDLDGSLGTASGIKLNFFANNGQGVSIRVGADGSGQQLDIVNTAASVWYSLRASQFLTQSDEAAKTDIQAVATSDMLTDILAMKVKRYHRLNMEDADTGEVCRNPREEIGFIAQDTPPRVSYMGADTQFVDTYQTLALTVGAVQEQQKIITAQRKELEAMKGKLLTIGVRL